MTIDKFIEYLVVFYAGLFAGIGILAFLMDGKRRDEAASQAAEDIAHF